MTKATAATVVKDLVTAGYNVEAVQAGDGTWTVNASSMTGPVDAATIGTFAASHGVSSTTERATFS